MKKAFTIIELVISIVIFGVGLLVILNILNKNIFLAKKVQIKTQATLIAKDSMEMVYNFRDSNNIKYKKWNYLTGTDTSIEYFQVGKAYKVYHNITGTKNILEEIINPNFLNTRLYLQTGNIENSVGELVYSGFYYNYFTGKKTNFGRYVVFTGVYLEPEGATKDDYILKLKSVVPYKFGGYYGKVELESFISGWR